LFLGLVVPCWVDCELSENFSCGGVNDVNVVVLNQDDDVGSGVGSPDSDVVHLAVDTKCDGSRGIDAVAPNPFVGVVVAGPSGGRFGHACIESRRRCVVG